MMPSVRSKTTNGGIYASFFAAGVKDPFTSDTGGKGIHGTRKASASSSTAESVNVSAYSHSHGGAFYGTPQFDAAGRGKLEGSQNWMDEKPGDNYLILTNVIARRTEHWVYSSSRRFIELPSYWISIFSGTMLRPYTRRVRAHLVPGFCPRDALPGMAGNRTSWERGMISDLFRSAIEVSLRGSDERHYS